MAEGKETKQNDHGSMSMYVRFMAMIGTSTAVMFVLMYVNTYDADHIFWSETRFWMSFVMGAAMMVVMLSFMLGMYQNRKKNLVIYAVAAVVFALALWLVRSQTTVTDTEYMKAMIPHHSIAIMTSERAHIRDPRVRKLAHDIILAQRREIAQMKYMIADIEENGVRMTERVPEEIER
jgi:peptidoglycan/LPS O-acetylase OafA/YrhL